MDEMKMSRRDALGAAGGVAGLAAAGLATVGLAPGAQAAPVGGKRKIDFVTRIDIKDPKWTRDTYARLDGDIAPGAEKCGWIRGKAFGVRDNEKVRPLFNVEGFSFVRINRQPDGSWRRLLREVVFYRDIDTNQILTEWVNPYSGEMVQVVPIANDPFNFTISEFVPEPPSYGGLQQVKHDPKPFLQDWQFGPDGTMILNTGIDMIYPNALQPETWPRESSGPMNRVSEQFIYVVKKADVENPNLTHIPHVGSWSRITPWLPWMLMGQAPGHMTYFTHFSTVPDGEKGLPKDLVAAARAMGEKWLHAPTEDYGPSLSSIENYAREHKPAPVPAGWSPPQPPAAPKPFAPRS